MSDFFVYAIGAALVDTEIAVTDADLDHLGVEKGMMTLVDEDRQTEIKTFLSDRLAAATHACGGSAGSSAGTGTRPGRHDSPAKKIDRLYFAASPSFGKRWQRQLCIFLPFILPFLELCGRCCTFTWAQRVC